MNQIRYFHPSLIYEVSRRVFDGEFRFDPIKYPQIAAAFHGIFARAQEEHGVTIYAYFVMSNHYHALYQAPNPDALADFLRDVHSAMARYTNIIHGRQGPVFGGRAHVKPVMVNEATLTVRLAYIMGQAIKIENSPWSVDNWPGANTNAALMHGDKLEGTHFDTHRKTLESRRKGGPQSDDEYLSRPHVELAVLPCWKHLSVEDQRARYKAVAASAVERFGNSGTFAPTVDDNQDDAADRGPACRPGNSCGAAPDTQAMASAPCIASTKYPKPKKSGRPKAHYIHSACKKDRDCFGQVYREICTSHRKAQKQLRKQTKRLLAGKRAKVIQFPTYTFGCAARIGDLRQKLELPDLPLLF